METMDTVELPGYRQTELIKESISEWKDFKLEPCILGTGEGVTFEKEILPEATDVYRIPAFEFNRWPAGLLVEYIYHVHHCYYYNEESALSALLEKVLSLNSVRHPPLQRLNTLWSNFKNQFSSHLLREERLLFEYIRHLSIAKRNNTFLMPTGIGKVETVIQSMKADHEAAQSVMAEIRLITNNYTTPYNITGCINILYNKLKAFDDRFQLDIHVENNILFPKAAMLERELAKLHLL
jgi:regulator of cell morphogenesis and NO signaling